MIRNCSNSKASTYGRDGPQVSISAQGSVQSPIQLVPGQGLTRSEREPGNCSPSNAEINNTWSFISTPPYVMMLINSNKIKYLFGFWGWCASNVENYPAFRQTLQLPSSERMCWLDNYTPFYSSVVSHIRHVPIYIHPADGSCSVCRKVGKFS
jgi:hypothetical protein